MSLMPAGGPYPSDHTLLAIKALTDHALKHHLPVPAAIATEDPCDGTPGLYVDVHGDHVDAWNLTLNVTREDNKLLVGVLDGQPCVATTVDATLPDLGIRVTLTALRFNTEGVAS